MENMKRGVAAVPAEDVKDAVDYAKIAEKVTETFVACMPKIVHTVRETTRNEEALDDAAHNAEKKAKTARHLDEFNATLKFILANQRDLLEAAKVIAAIKDACPEIVKQLL